LQDKDTIKTAIEKGSTYLGIELGSTRIKAVLIDSRYQPIASGSHVWENALVDGFWTYRLEDIWRGLRDCYAKLSDDVERQYGVRLTRLGAIGFSGMMHGFMAFDQEGNLLVPFRTWRNTTTGESQHSADGAVPFQYPPAVEHCPSVPGDS
jgi:sugar (pentulose or hexulose) kinase